ncbi:MAG: glucosyl-3-phosphoglycerate synthase [Nitriliruptorales bacterium]|nr:glucosyl-3-phosphoglycerate synthase [Nitriliruptorales bacterium]
MASSLSSSTPALEWFARRSARAEDYEVAALAERKRTSGTSVSVVLPAREEAATIGEVVDAVCELADVLVDEIVVMDGGSTDGTPDIAAARGARVHQADMVLPQYGSSQGKGDSLWRSLAVTGGDIVVFLDADLHNPDSRFVVGLLGPLLTQPSIHLVKAFYERPVKLGRVQHDTGGGRVTELTARPLINMYWPELAGLVQPLSGEYAARRPLLERIPFFTGYGVELGMLIDTLEALGADAIAQVDLSCRVHRNQSLPALSRMAFGILQVVAQRLHAEGRADQPHSAKGPLEYLQFERRNGRVRAEPQAVSILQRPPMSSLF